eukprot:TRINITY_DN70991_c0_g1_i1.p1 TRINITY_DN70991_c0_g1~~TRINITY_DN70991_c0_g1_i1.p1  ORF type:complete len:515 (+),score=105.50 TRINITY_DN70991_c0_g1_i1:76-1620(+)
MRRGAVLMVLTAASADKVPVRIKQDVVSTSTTTGQATERPCPPGSPLMLSFALEQSTDKIYGTVGHFSGTFEPFVVAAGDRFEYEMAWLDSGANGNVDLESTGSGWRLRDDEGALDEDGKRNHVEHERLGALCEKQYCKRSFPLSGATGNRTDLLVFAANPGVGRTVRMMLRYARVRSADGAVTSVLWEPGHRPITIHAYFPGTVTSQCALTHSLSGSLNCTMPPPPPPAWRPGLLYPPPVATLGEPLSCAANLSLALDGASGMRRVSVSLHTLSAGLFTAGLAAPLWEEARPVALPGESAEGAVRAAGAVAPAEGNSAATLRAGALDAALRWEMTPRAGAGPCCSALLQRAYERSNLSVSLTLSVKWAAAGVEWEEGGVIELPGLEVSVVCGGQPLHDEEEALRRALEALRDPAEPGGGAAVLSDFLEKGDRVRAAAGNLSSGDWLLNGTETAVVEEASAVSPRVTLRGPGGALSPELQRRTLLPTGCPAALRRRRGAAAAAVCRQLEPHKEL